MVEFALVFPVMLAAVFFMLAALFYVTEDTSVVAATQVGSRIAAAAGTSAAGGPNALDEVARRLPALLEPGLPGTVIAFHVQGNCPPPSTVTEAGHLAVCSGYAIGASSGTPVITVRIYGRLPALLPGFPAFPIDEQATVHSLTFQR